MIIFLALILFSPSVYSMGNYYGRRPQNNEKVFQECLNALDTYDDGIIGYPGMSLIVEHPHFLELMQRTADQDALWINRRERALTLLIDCIEDRMTHFRIKPSTIQVQLLGVFLTAAAQKGHTDFINSQTLISRQTLLGQAIQENNIACTQKILEYKPSLDIQCYCNKAKQPHYLLKAAYLDFGPQSEMVQLLRAHGATLKPEDKDLLLKSLD